jgi:hypothetical protein
VEQGEVQIEHCDTNKMVADFFTKPLQGGLFTRYRNQILNINNNKDEAAPKAYAASQENVGIKGIKAIRLMIQRLANVQRNHQRKLNYSLY